MTRRTSERDPCVPTTGTSDDCGASSEGHPTSRRTWLRAPAAAALTLLAWCGLPATAIAVTFAPANGQSEVCVDAPLSIGFAAAPTLGSSGSIRLFRTDGTLVDTIDLANPASSRRVVGNAVSDTGLVHLWRYSPVIITGNTIT